MTTINPTIHQSRLTRRESEILYLIAHEYTTEMIAGKLYISSHTVVSHRKKLLEKMNVRNVAGLIRRAFETSELTF